MTSMRLSLLFLLFLFSISSAATVERLALPELTARAGQIFVGRCQRAEPELRKGKIYTRYLFAVEETVKGQVQREVELLLPGGAHQGIRTRVPGMPVFSPGEEVVLFLTGTPSNPSWPVGLGQGKFRIERRGAAKRARVFQELDGLSFTLPAAGKAALLLPIQGMPLETFLSQVRALSGSASGVERDVR